MKDKDHQQKTVLVVDDEASIVMLVSAILRDSGYNVLTASGGLEALKLSGAFKHDIHLLVSDFIMLPGMTGFELATKLSAERPALKVLLMSGLTQGGPLALGEGWEYLGKPFMRRELLECIDDLI